MSDTAVVVLSNVEEAHGNNDKGPWTKYTFLDGNGQRIAATFSTPVGDAGKSLIGQRVQIDLKPSDNPKFAPTAIAIKPAPEETSKNGDGALSKDEWLLKDRAADRRACIAIAASSLTHTLKSEPTQEQLREFSGRVLHMGAIFHAAVMRERGLDPDADVPFE